MQAHKIHISKGARPLNARPGDVYPVHALWDACQQEMNQKGKHGNS